ncbi:hypothetical protein AU377_08215 [Sporosarcina sp. HYO08]|nr:hypothetical protein AU377_08215 [Sporosarcina sp. HYO08]
MAPFYTIRLKVKESIISDISIIAYFVEDLHKNFIIGMKVAIFLCTARGNGEIYLNKDWQ